MKLLSRVQLFATPRTAAYQAPPSMGFSRPEYWSGVPLPSPKIPLGVVFSFWAQTALPTSSSSVPFTFWPSEAFSFVLICRTHLILLLFCLYLQISFYCLPECPPVSSLTSQSPVKCSLPLMLVTSSLSSLDSSSTCCLQHCALLTLLMPLKTRDSLMWNQEHWA